MDIGKVIQDGAALAIAGFAILVVTAPWWLKAVVWTLGTVLGALSSVGQP